MEPGALAKFNAAADPVAAFFRAKTTSVALTAAFVTLGLCFMARGADMPQWYPVFLVFFVLKILTDYRKCTISYVECKVRGVGRDRGLLDSLLGGVLDLRLVPGFRTTAALYAAAVLWFYFLVRGQSISV